SYELQPMTSPHFNRRIIFFSTQLPARPPWTARATTSPRRHGHAEAAAGEHGDGELVVRHTQVTRLRIPCTLVVALGPVQLGFTGGFSSPTQDAMTGDLNFSISEVIVDPFIACL
uniref:Uncharacterized protein n=1 Tax=Aegilops tauschii subsp. strangulata TaxID=200361 RepID=A0A453J4C8_AEGTS